MPDVIKLSRARSDLIEIWNCIADDSEALADAFIDIIDQKLLALASNPDMGRAREELAKGVRSFPAGSCVIFYRPISNGIEIGRVLHGARDIAALFH